MCLTRPPIKQVFSRSSIWKVVSFRLTNSLGHSGRGQNDSAPIYCTSPALLKTPSMPMPAKLTLRACLRVQQQVELFTGTILLLWTIASCFITYQQNSISVLREPSPKDPDKHTKASRTATQSFKLASICLSDSWLCAVPIKQIFLIFWGWKWHFHGCTRFWNQVCRTLTSTILHY